MYKRQLLKFEDLFSASEIENLYLYVQNFCAIQINTGDVSYFRELFIIYKTMLERGILPGKKDLKPGVFKNIMTLSFMLGEYNWVEQFVEKFTDSLPKEHRENAKNFNLAKIYFHQKQYLKVIEQLGEVEYKNLSYALSGKLMLLKTYFELNETRALEGLIESFRIYLRRNKFISKEVRQQYLNLLRFTRKIFALPPHDKSGTQKVLEQINKCAALADKKWLLDKIGERN